LGALANSIFTCNNVSRVVSFTADRLPDTESGYQDSYIQRSHQRDRNEVRISVAMPNGPMCSQVADFAAQSLNEQGTDLNVFLFAQAIQRSVYFLFNLSIHL
jgi:hypothetical protein